MARVAAVNGLTIPQLLEYAGGTPSHSQILHVDYDASRSLIAGLAQACRISQDSLAEINLRVQLPNAPTSLFLPVIHNVQNGYKRSAIAIPSCHACLGDRERMGTTPYWKVEMPQASRAFVGILPSLFARHAVSGGTTQAWRTRCPLHGLLPGYGISPSTRPSRVVSSYAACCDHGASAGFRLPRPRS